MNPHIHPGSIVLPPQVLERAADALRAMALDETLKARVGQDALLARVLERVARRYVAGSSTDAALPRIAAILERGHAASVEYLGESCRVESEANAATEVFLGLIAALDARRLPCSISLDLSHVGSVIDPALGLHNVARIARQAAASGRELMISMEGSDRTDTILDTYVRLHEHGHAATGNVGITIQSRLHRSDHDLSRLLALPGRIRLVKGAYLEPIDAAHPRGSRELRSAYLRHAALLIGSRHRCSIATHDASIHAELTPLVAAQQAHTSFCEFESLIGLGTAQIDALRRQGFATREYAVYGEEHYLYVLNRISEDPARLFQAVVDAAG
jgi:proline dehydrogenase